MALHPLHVPHGREVLLLTHPSRMLSSPRRVRVSPHSGSRSGEARIGVLHESTATYNIKKWEMLPRPAMGGS